MFRPGFYIHENAMDTYMEVIKVQYRDHKRTKMRVVWWNMGFTNQPWKITQSHSLEISRKLSNGWRHFDPDTEIDVFRKKQQEKQLFNDKS